MATYSGRSMHKSRSLLWGFGGLLAGLVLGVLLILVGLVTLAPRPQQAAPTTTSESNGISVSIDDAYLTQMLSSEISNTALPIRLSNLQAEILPAGQVKLSGDARGLLPVDTHLAAITEIQVQSGQLRMHILSAQVGGLTLPTAITDALERTMNSKLAQATGRLMPPHFVATGVSTTRHHLLMTIAQR